VNDQRRGQNQTAAAERTAAPSGPRLGPIPITVTGVLIVVALVLSLAYFAYAISVRDASQIPLLASGLVVLGLVFIAIAVVGARAAWRSSVRGSDARAFGHSIVGGIASLVASGCFALAVILFLVNNH
jgi:type III secretory pathway component EscV